MGKKYYNETNKSYIKQKLVNKFNGSLASSGQDKNIRNVQKHEIAQATRKKLIQWQLNFMHVHDKFTCTNKNQGLTQSNTMRQTESQS